MTSKLDIQSKTLHHKKIQKETQNSSIVDQNLLIDPFSNLNGKCKIHDNNLENNVSLYCLIKAYTTNSHL